MGSVFTFRNDLENPHPPAPSPASGQRGSRNEPWVRGGLRAARLLPAAAVLIWTAACAPSGETGDAPAGGDGDAVEILAAAQTAAELIDEASLKEPIAILSADDMEGRGPGSAGDAKARAYMIEQMKAAGLEPGAADGSWEQPFDIVGLTAEVPDTWTFKADSGELTIQRHDQFIAFSGVQSETATIENAEVVFVGYGIEAPEYGWDDWGDVDMTGKVVLMLNNDPDWDEDLFEGDRRLWYGRWDYKYMMAAKKGAVGAIIHHTRASAGYPFGVVQSSWTGPQFELPDAGEARLQVGAWTTEETTRELVALAGHDWDGLEEKARNVDFEPVPLGLTTSLQLKTAVETTATTNIIGVLPGSDPELKAEMVIYGAHHDHIGIGEPDADGDTIYNGAVDNAAGVAQVLAAAKAFQSLPRAPKRSIMFALWGAEEQGLLGSRFFAANPPVAPGRMAANVNIDGGNIFGTTEDVVFVGFGKSDLDEVVKRRAAEQEREVVGDQFPDRGYFYRSDQFNLAKIGVPAIYLNTGTVFDGREEGWGKEQLEAWEGEKYHQQGDELDETWIFDGMVEDARLAFLAGVDIAEADALPAWNAGDEFEAARQAALAALGDED